MSADTRDQGNTGSAVEVVDNPEAQRYEAYVEGGLAGFLLYEPRPGRVVSVLDVPLPRPRARTDLAVVALREQALAALGVAE